MRPHGGSSTRQVVDAVISVAVCRLLPCSTSHKTTRLVTVADHERGPPSTTTAAPVPRTVGQAWVLDSPVSRAKPGVRAGEADRVLEDLRCMHLPLPSRQVRDGPGRCL